MTRGIRNNNPIAIGTETAKTDTASATSVGGTGLSSPHHASVSGTPRGLRNNNPLNIRISNNNWQGKVLVNNDGEFEQFISMEYGFRAALLTIETYILKHGCNTIRKIITRFAPPTDGNNTERYIRFVCMATNIGGEEPLSNHDRRLKGIVAAMARVESGAGIVDYQSSLDKAFDAFVPREQTEKEYKKKYS